MLSQVFPLFPYQVHLMRSLSNIQCERRIQFLNLMCVRSIIAIDPDREQLLRILLAADLDLQRTSGVSDIRTGITTMCTALADSLGSQPPSPLR